MLQFIHSDIAFVFDSPQRMDYECKEVTHIPFVMVSSEANQSVDEAIKRNYILVEWGSSFAQAHARYFPDMPVPRIRVMLGRIALDYLLVNGGTAYLAEPMISALLQAKKLYLVNDAPVIRRSVYALFPHNNEKQNLVESVCRYFE